MATKTQIKNPNSTLDNHVMEVLVCLEYLLNETNANNYTKQTAITDYALQSKYDINPRRDRIARILEVIAMYKEEIEDFLHVKIKEVKTGNSYKYYISERLFSIEEIADLITSINANPGLTEQNKAKLRKHLLEITTQRDDDVRRDKIEELVTKADFRNVRFSKNELRIYEAIKSKDNGYSFARIELEMDYYKQKIIQNFQEPFILEGYIFKVFEMKQDLYLYLVSSKSGRVITIPLKKIVRFDIYDDGVNLKELNKIFKEDGFNTIDEFISSRHILMSEESRVNFRFIMDPYNENYSYINDLFHSIFHCDMPVVDAIKDHGKTKKIKIEIESEHWPIYQFLHDLKVLETCQILEPSNVKDALRKDLRKALKNLQ